MSKSINKPEEKKEPLMKDIDELFGNKNPETDEIESDGSASAFDSTENVGEDNFDDLSEK
jgi:hypothetical protein